MHDICNELEILKSTILDKVAVEKIILFGSYANGTPNDESDIDLYVVLKDDSEMDELDALKSIYKGLRYKLNIPIDILASCKSSFERRSKLLTLENDIASEGVIIYPGFDTWIKRNGTNKPFLHSGIRRLSLGACFLGHIGAIDEAFFKRLKTSKK